MSVLQLTPKSGLGPSGGAVTTYFPTNGSACTPSDVNTYDTPATVFVGVTGIVVCIPWGNGPGGASVSFMVQAGTWVPVRVCAVLASGTTASSLILIY